MLWAGGPAAPMPCSLAVSETPAGSEPSTFSTSFSSLSHGPLWCAESQFHLHLQPSVYAQLSSLIHALNTAGYRPSPVSAQFSGPLIGPAIDRLRQLLLSLRLQSTDSEDRQRMKVSWWMQHYQQSTVQCLIQHVQRSTRRYEEVQGGKGEQALYLLSDISHLVDLLPDADPNRSTILTPTLISTSCIPHLHTARTHLASVCVEHCRVWLVQQHELMFGRQLATFPLVLPVFPRPLPMVEDFALLFPPDTVPVAGARVVSPYLCLYMQWFDPIRQVVSRLHPRE